MEDIGSGPGAVLLGRLQRIGRCCWLFVLHRIVLAVKHDGQAERLAVALDGERRVLAAAVVPQRRAEVGKRAHGVVIKRKDKVAVAQARMGAGGILCD